MSTSRLRATWNANTRTDGTSRASLRVSDCVLFQLLAGTDAPFVLYRDVIWFNSLDAATRLTDWLTALRCDAQPSMILPYRCACISAENECHMLERMRKVGNSSTPAPYHPISYHQLANELIAALLYAYGLPVAYASRIVSSKTYDSSGSMSCLYV